MGGEQLQSEEDNKGKLVSLSPSPPLPSRRSGHVLSDPLPQGQPGYLETSLCPQSQPVPPLSKLLPLDALDGFRSPVSQDWRLLQEPRVLGKFNCALMEAFTLYYMILYLHPECEVCIWLLICRMPLRLSLFAPPAPPSAPAFPSTHPLPSLLP